MTVWDDVKALYGKGGLEVVTAVDSLSIRSIIQPDADVIIWLSDFTQPDIDPDQFTTLWQRHQQAIGKRMAGLNRLFWLIQEGGLLLVPVPFLLSVFINISRNTLDQLIVYLIGLLSSAVFYFLRSQINQLAARMVTRLLHNRLQKFRQNFMEGKLTPPNYGRDT